MHRSTLFLLSASICLSGIVGLLAAAPAHAALGGVDTSTQADAATLGATLAVEPHTLYTVHEIRMPSGTIVREFVNGAGRIFAVTWRGPTAPNLKQLYGSYFDRYAAAARGGAKNHHHLAVLDRELVAHASGHMRAMSGRAYLSNAVPNGVVLSELN